MSNDQDYVERTIDAPPKLSMETVERARAPNTMGWWIAAIVAIVAVAAVIVVLSGAHPSAAQLQAVSNQNHVEAQADRAADGAGLAATRAARSAQAAAQSNAQATESAAQVAALNANVAAQAASTTEPVASAATPQ